MLTAATVNTTQERSIEYPNHEKTKPPFCYSNIAYQSKFCKYPKGKKTEGKKKGLKKEYAQSKAEKVRKGKAKFSAGRLG